jgi:hypothetical protein
MSCGFVKVEVELEDRALEFGRVVESLTAMTVAYRT